MKRFLAVGGGGTVDRLKAYLYTWDEVLSYAESNNRVVAVVSVEGTDEGNADFRADYLADRLGSGMYGVSVFKSVDEANAESVLKRFLLSV